MKKPKPKKARPEPPPKKASTQLVDDLIHEAKLEALCELRGQASHVEQASYKVKTARSKVLALIFQLESKGVQA